MRVDLADADAVSRADALRAVVEAWRAMLAPGVVVVDIDLAFSCGAWCWGHSVSMIAPNRS